MGHTLNNQHCRTCFLSKKTSIFPYSLFLLLNLLNVIYNLDDMIILMQVLVIVTLDYKTIEVSGFSSIYERPARSMLSRVFSIIFTYVKILKINSQLSFLYL